VYIMVLENEGIRVLY